MFLSPIDYSYNSPNIRLDCYLGSAITDGIARVYVALHGEREQLKCYKSDDIIIDSYKEFTDKKRTPDIVLESLNFSISPVEHY